MEGPAVSVAQEGQIPGIDLPAHSERDKPRHNMVKVTPRLKASEAAPDDYEQGRGKKLRKPSFRCLGRPSQRKG